MKKFFDFFVEKVKCIWNSDGLKTILILVIVFLLLMDYFGLSLFTGKIDSECFGTVGDWFSNFAMLITIAIAAFTVVNDKRIAETERIYNEKVRDDDYKKSLEAQEMAKELHSQAVYVWIAGEQDPVTNMVHDFKIYISNKTGAPVFQWYIYNASNEMIANSSIYGPLLPEICMTINGIELNKNDKVSLEYLSYINKWWLRDNAEVREINHA